MSYFLRKAIAVLPDRWADAADDAADSYPAVAEVDSNDILPILCK